MRQGICRWLGTGGPGKGRGSGLGRSERGKEGGGERRRGGEKRGNDIG